MKIIGKQFRDLTHSRGKLTLLTFFTLLCLIYLFSCELNLSANCQTTYHILPKKSVVPLNQIPTDKSPSDGDIIPPGGTFYRSSPVNRTEVELFVDELVRDYRESRLMEHHERQRVNDEMKRQLEREMNANLDNIDLENWNLDNYYHMPRTPRKPTPQVQKQLSGMEQKQTILVTQPAPPKLNIFPEPKVYSISKQSHGAQDTGTRVASGFAGQADSNVYLSRELEEADGPDDEDTGVVSKHETINAFETTVKKKVVQNAVVNAGGQGALTPGDQDNKALLEFARKKAKKKKKSNKPKKSIPILPNSFPFFETKHPAAQIGDYTCSNSLCSEFLSKSDMKFYKFCVSRFKKSDNYKNTSYASGECHFMSGTNRSAVALASFPGSGNTWVRGLLEKVTKVCTGSIYCDNSLRASGMNGEGVRSGAVLVVKTHKSIPVSWTTEEKPSMDSTDSDKKNPSYGAAILVIRNPGDALVAEWNRLMSKNDGHTSQLGREAFGANPKWESFLHRKLQTWQAYFKFWVVNGAHHRVLVIKYEDLKADTMGTLKKVLEFLKYPYNDEELAQKLSEDFGTFKRKHKVEFEHFTNTQKTAIRRTISQTVDYLRASNHGNTFSIEDYLTLY